MSERIIIVLPVHNRKQITSKFISSLKAQTYDNYHLLLIDDGSIDETSEMVLQEIASTTVIKGKGEWWWAGSLQQGLNWIKQNNVSGEEIILFSNDDIILPSDFLRKAIGIMSELDSTLLLPQLYDNNKLIALESGVEVDFKNLTFKIASDQMHINCLSTRGLLLRASDLYRIGNFYPRLLPHYLSDYEFTIRAFKKGLNLKTTPDLVVTMDASQSGFREFEGISFINFLRQFFSKKSVSNPVYYTAFLILASPMAYLPINIIRVWFAAAKLIARQAIKSRAVV